MIYVLIPAFNEAEPLRELLPSVPDSVAGMPVRKIVISDGSTDGTPEIADEFGAEVIALSTNQGKGAALKVGKARTAGRQFECVVFMDGDGQHDPRYLSKLAAPVLSGRYDLVVGSRYLSDPHRGNAPLNRYLVRRVVSRYLERLLTQPVSDPFSGYRCLSRPAFKAIEMLGSEYQGELEMRFEAEIRALRVLEVAVPRIYTARFSKMSRRGGALLGRLRVLGQYLEVIVRKRRELASVALDEDLDADRSGSATTGRARGAGRL